MIGSKVSKQLRKIVEKCTKVKPETRPNIEDIINDEYFSNDHQMSNFVDSLDDCLM